MKLKQPTEDKEQRGFLTWWKTHYPGLIVFHIPNGGWRDINTAKKLREEGVLKGVPDLYCPKLHLWIEMKRVSGGVISPEQEKMIEYLRRIGDHVIVAYGAEDASRQFMEFLKCPK